MPTIPLDEFDSPPDIGDKVTVKGKVERIDEDTDEVYISYDSVEVNNEEDKKKKKKKHDYNNDNNPPDYVTVDEAMSRAFPTNPAATPPPGPGAFQG